jgi:hypothetical protein
MTAAPLGHHPLVHDQGRHRLALDVLRYNEQWFAALHHSLEAADLPARGQTRGLVVICQEP